MRLQFGEGGLFLRALLQGGWWCMPSCKEDYSQAFYRLHKFLYQSFLCLESPKGAVFRHGDHVKARWQACVFSLMP